MTFGAQISIEYAQLKVMTFGAQTEAQILSHFYWVRTIKGDDIWCTNFYRVHTTKGDDIWCTNFYRVRTTKGDDIWCTNFYWVCTTKVDDIWCTKQTEAQILSLALYIDNVSRGTAVFLILLMYKITYLEVSIFWSNRTTDHECLHLKCKEKLSYRINSQVPKFLWKKEHKVVAL